MVILVNHVFWDKELQLGEKTEVEIEISLR